MEPGHDLSMSIKPCSPPTPQLTPHKSQPKALVIPALEALINVLSVEELKGLNVKMLAINDCIRLYSVSKKRNE